MRPDRAPRRAPLEALAVDLLVGVTIVLVALQAWWTRYAFNPDGISYLDLAGRLRAGDLHSFVQGYWSPAFPLLIAGVSVLTGGAPSTMLLVAHALSAAALVGAILLLRRWGRRTGRPRFTVAALLALLLVSDGFPKLETVTPDLLLLAALVWLGYELLPRTGERWRTVGVLFGLTFLIKTSVWPWLLLALPLRLWAAKEKSERRQVLWSGVITVLIAALWILPLSLRSGTLTVGSAARLNYSWYLLDSGESRTPDTHTGGHTSYHVAALDSVHTLTWAEFADGDRWTYAPWSDPTAWDAGILSRKENPAPARTVIPFWRHQVRNVFRFWLLPLLLAVVLPWGALTWVPAIRARRWSVGRPGLVAGALGVAGVMQFVMVHAEPRLIAPYALLFALALLHEPPAAAGDDDAFISRHWPWVAALGLVVVGVKTKTALRSGYTIDRHQRSLLGSIASTRAAVASAGVSGSEIVVVGRAIPVEGMAYLSGARIVAQVLPGSVGALMARPAPAQQEVLARLFAGKTRLIWMTDPDGVVTAELLPLVPSPAGEP